MGLCNNMKTVICMKLYNTGKNTVEVYSLAEMHAMHVIIT